MKLYDFRHLRHATLKLRHHESAIRIAFSGLPHLLLKAISLLPTYMFTLIFLQHADFEKRRKRYTYCVFVPSGLPRGNDRPPKIDPKIDPKISPKIPPINQSANRLIDQSTNHLIDIPPIDQSINQPIDQSTNQPSGQ